MTGDKAGFLRFADGGLHNGTGEFVFTVIRKNTACFGRKLKKAYQRIHDIPLGFRAIDDDGGLRNGVGRGLFELIEVHRVFHDVTVHKGNPVAGGAVFFGKPLDIG